MLRKRKDSQDNDDTNRPSPDKCKRIRQSSLSPRKTLITHRGKLVIIEGNIGVGKTTLSQRLATLLKYKLFLEPTSKNPYLEKFYAEPKKYALKLQLWIFQQRLMIYIQAVKHMFETGQGVLLDRSVFSDKVFADVGFADSNITPEGYGFYMSIRGRALEGLPIPHVTLFLNTDPKVCQQRIKTRGRSCEKGIPVSYLQSLHDAYQVFIAEMREVGSKVHTLDWTDFGEAKPIQEEIQDSREVCWSELVRTGFSEFCSSSLAPLEQVLCKGLQSSQGKENIGPDVSKIQEEELKAFEKEQTNSTEPEVTVSPGEGRQDKED